MRDFVVIENPMKEKIKKHCANEGDMKTEFISVKNVLPKDW